MFFIGIVLVACALLAWLLVSLRRYEHESAAAALEMAAGLKEEMQALRLRIEALEAIAAAGDAPPGLSDEPESLTSAERSRIRS